MNYFGVSKHADVTFDTEIKIRNKYNFIVGMYRGIVCTTI